MLKCPCLVAISLASIALLALECGAREMSAADRALVTNQLFNGTSNGAALPTGSERLVAASKPAKKKGRSFERDCLVAHNKWRRLHQAHPVRLDPKLTEFAQRRADLIAKSDGVEFKHPKDLDYGENLAWHSRNTSGCGKLVKMWYDEIKLYKFEEGAFAHETGHFTQLVWNSSERIGCARAISSGPKGGVYLVCNYDPPGNFLGEFKENVRSSRSNQTNTTTGAPATTVAPASSSKPAASPTTVAPAATSTTSASTGADRLSPDEEKKRKKNKAKKKNKNKPKKKKVPPSTTLAPTISPASESSEPSTESILSNKPKRVTGQDSRPPRRRARQIEAPNEACS